MRRNAPSKELTMTQPDKKKQKKLAKTRHPVDPLRGNPVVGFMSEEQAERILAEMRGERK